MHTISDHLNICANTDKTERETDKSTIIGHFNNPVSKWIELSHRTSIRNLKKRTTL